MHPFANNMLTPVSDQPYEQMSGPEEEEAVQPTGSSNAIAVQQCRELLSVSLSTRYTTPRNRTLCHGVCGVTLGIIGDLLYNTTGGATTVHEILGHGEMGGYLTHDFITPPRYQIDAWDNIAALRESKSVGQGFENFFRFLIGYDINHDGASGVTWMGKGPPNALGNVMGPELLRGWISLTGSLPSLMMNIVTLSAAMKMRHRFPRIGWALLSGVFMQHVADCTYPWTCAGQSQSGLESMAHKGHDFATVALVLGQMTQTSAHNWSWIIPMIWTCSVPFLFGCLLLHEKTHQANMVSKQQVMQGRLVQAIENEHVLVALDKTQSKRPSWRQMRTLLENRRALYAQPELDTSSMLQGKLQELNDSIQKLALQNSRELTTSMSMKTSWQAKRHMLRQWHPLQDNDMSQRLFTGTMLLSVGSATISRVLGLLGRTVAPQCSNAALILRGVFIPLQGAAVSVSFYEAVQDLRTPTALMPVGAKVMSSLKVLVSSTGMALGCSTLFLPGGGEYFQPIMAATLLTLLGVRTARACLIRKPMRDSIDRYLRDASLAEQIV